jgi:hypothetical protein
MGPYRRPYYYALREPGISEPSIVITGESELGGFILTSKLGLVLIYLEP